jgi:hypothetical protein
MAKKRVDPPPLEPREFKSLEEVDFAITKLKRRIRDLEQLDRADLTKNTGAESPV